jgi:hypothetical protein
MEDERERERGKEAAMLYPGSMSLFSLLSSSSPFS